MSTELEAPKATFEWLHNTICTDLTEFEELMHRRKRTIFWLRIFVAAFGGIATVLVGLQQNSNFTTLHPHFSVAALLATALVSLFVTWEGIFDYRGDWERFKATYGQLYGLRYSLEYLQSQGGMTQKKLDEIFEKLNKLIVDANRPRARAGK